MEERETKKQVRGRKPLKIYSSCGLEVHLKTEQRDAAFP
jgi:hypothetical protein